MRLPKTPAAAIALTLMLLALWLLTHRYQGLAQDARIYAFQAMARITPALGQDLFLQNTTQDRYTLFSPFYALVIGLMGLQSAARALTVLFTAVFFAASWRLARALVGKDAAWLSVGALILTVGAYGSHGVFHFAEDYLSARSAAEAMIATALAVHLGGYRLTALILATAALFVHPLMAMPGVLLLIFLVLSTRRAATLAVAGIVLTSGLAMAASISPGFRSVVPTMDGAWLDVVRERSQFLFLQLWSLRDWETNLRPFASLGLSAAILADGKTRRLCLAAALVGASGLLVALEAGTIGPVAFLVQGQAWRWVWIAVFIATILMPSTAVRLWQDDTAGPLCAVLLAASWTLSASDAPSLAPLALLLFMVRGRFAAVPHRVVKAAALAVGLALLGRELIGVITPPADLVSSAGIHPPFLQRAGTLAAGRYPLALLTLLGWHWLLASNSRRRPATAGMLLGGACVLLAPIAFARTNAAGSMQEITEFADWRRVIPPSANVYVANGRDAAPFAWFTLQRPNYLSLDQSAGVVFSRATALEVRRRSQVLMPLMDEDWKLLSKNRVALAGGIGAAPRLTPLTAKSLSSLCNDSRLDFLIARESIGFDAVRHAHPGPWMNWNLYSCAQVRTPGPAI